MNYPELYSQRSPGLTCLSALANGGQGSIERPINDSKGCGGVMRIAPIGLFFPVDRVGGDLIQDLAARAAALTHGHKLGYLPAALLAQIISELIYHNTSLMEAIRSSLEIFENHFPESADKTYLHHLVEKAIFLASSGLSDLDCIHQLGEGWVAEETLAIALYACLKYPEDFAKVIRVAVNHSGDSDSTGAVAGNIMGAQLGYEAIPDAFKSQLELKHLILQLADQIINSRKKA